MKFSQRIGVTPPEKLLQKDSVDTDLLNSLWSALTVFYWEQYDKSQSIKSDSISGSNLSNLFDRLWIYYFKHPLDNLPPKFYGDPGGHSVLRNYFFNAEWYEIYDFIEFIAQHGPEPWKEPFINSCNEFLERENSGYRFVDERIIEISSAEEINEIEAAIKNATPYYGVKQHLDTAISMLSEKEKPDYRNSIKESISAVESLCKKISENDKVTLGAALTTLEKRGILHPALKSAFSSLYGYTNDANGIRHALLQESNLTSADARFMLISCSAFINYVIASEASSM